MEGTESNYQWYVGIDWGAERYRVCVLDRQAHVVARKSIEHSGTGIAEFVDWLVKWCAGKPREDSDLDRDSAWSDGGRRLGGADLCGVRD